MAWNKYKQKRHEEHPYERAKESFEQGRRQLHSAVGLSILWLVALIIDGTSAVASYFASDLVGVGIFFILSIVFFFTDGGKALYFYIGLFGIFLIILKVVCAFFIPYSGLAPILLLALSLRGVSFSSQRSPYSQGSGGGGMGYAQSTNSSRRPSAIDEGYGKALGDLAARQGISPAMYRFRQIASTLIPWFVLLLLIVGVIALFASNSGSTIAEYLGVQALTASEQFGLDQLAVLFNKYNPITRAQREITGIGSFAPPDSQPTQQIEGVLLSSLEVDQGQLFSDSILRFTTAATIDALDADATVLFACGAKDPSTGQEFAGTIELSGKEADDGDDFIRVQGPYDRSIDITCILPKLSGPTGTNTIKSYQAYLDWAYHGFTTTTVAKALTVDSATKQSKAYSLAPYQQEIDAKGYARDVCVYNCGVSDLALDVRGTLPLIETESYEISVALVNLFASLRTGDIRQLTSIQLQTPEGFEVIQDRCKHFGPDLLFDSSDEPLFSGVAAAIKKKEIPSDQIVLRCAVKPVMVSEVVTLAPFTATAIYDYGGRKVTTLTINKAIDSVTQGVIA